LNTKTPSSVLILALTLIMIMPEAPPILALAQTTAMVSINPCFSVGDPGSLFQVEVDISGVPSLVAYDLSFEFNPVSLNATAVDFDASTVVAGTSHFNVATIVDNSIGQVRYAVTLLGGNVVDASGTVTALKLTLQVVGTQDSPISIAAQIVQLVNGVPTTVSNVIVSSCRFVVPPTILIVPPNSDVRPGQRLRRISKAQDHVDLLGYIQLAPNSTRPGFGGVVFDIVGPNGEVQVFSSIAFMFPGNSTTVTASFSYPLDSSSIGTYNYSVLAVRCVTTTACIQGTKAYMSLDGPFFKVKA